MAERLLSFENITKRLGGTTALRGVTLHLDSGEVLALLGENGAGKSTLIKALAGIHVPDEGRILFKGTPYTHMPRRVPARSRKWPSSIRIWASSNG